MYWCVFGFKFDKLHKCLVEQANKRVRGNSREYVHYQLSVTLHYFAFAYRDYKTWWSPGRTLVNSRNHKLNTLQPLILYQYAVGPVFWHRWCLMGLGQSLMHVSQRITICALLATRGTCILNMT